MILLAQSAALLAIMGVAIVYGTDTFSALVMRSALARVDDAALTAVMGNVHRFGDRRMPVPGVIGLVGAVAAAVLALVGGRPPQGIAAGIALVLLIVWTLLYARVSAPINRRLTAASDTGDTPADVRGLQGDWDGIIVLRAVLQGVAVLALGVSLILG